MKIEVILYYCGSLSLSSGSSQESLWPTVESQNGWGAAFPKFSLSPSDTPVPLWTPGCVCASVALGENRVVLVSLGCRSAFLQLRETHLGELLSTRISAHWSKWSVPFTKGSGA